MNEMKHSTTKIICQLNFNYRNDVEGHKAKKKNQHEHFKTIKLLNKF